MKADAGALVKRTAVQSIPTGAWTAVAWDAEIRDTDSIHDNSTNNTRLTVPTGFSRVRLIGQAHFASGSGDRGIWIQKNGASFAGGPLTLIAASAGSHVQNAVSTFLEVSASDYFEMLVYQTSGANLDLSATDWSWFSMELIK